MQNENNNFGNLFSDRLKTVVGKDTQPIISKRLNCSQQLISKYIQGEIPGAFVFLSKLAIEYKVDLNWLLTGQITGFIEKLYDRHVKFTERFTTYVMPHLNDIFTEQKRVKEILDSSKNLLDEQRKIYEDLLQELKKDENKTISDLKLLQEFPWGGNSYDDDPIKTYETFILGGQNPTELK